MFSRLPIRWEDWVGIWSPRDKTVVEPVEAMP